VTDSGDPRRGRHSSDGVAGARGFWADGAGSPTGGLPPVPPTRGYAGIGGDRSTSGFRPQGLLDRTPAQTGPLVEPDWWSYGSSAHPNYPPRARFATDDRPMGAGAWGEHPSAPLPPRPVGVWDRLTPRGSDPWDDAQTVAHPAPSVQGPRDPGDEALHDEPLRHHEARHYDPRDDQGDDHGRDHRGDPRDEPHLPHPAWEEQTGGLDVIGAHVEDNAHRRRGLLRRVRPVRADSARDAGVDGRSPEVPAHGRGHDDVHYDDHYDDHHYDDVHYDDVHDVDQHEHGAHFGGVPFDEIHEDDLHPDEVVHVDGQTIPVAPYDRRRRGGRRRRRPVAVLVSLLVLAGIVLGIVLGGQKLLGMIDPSARDFTGQGAGTVQIRVHDGDTLSDIARTLVADGVIASERPFVNAAEAHPDATGIQPGVYSLREQMSSQAALDMLLNPKARLLSRVTLPEGLTVAVTLSRLASSTGTPITQLKAAAANTAALGLPPYAHGKLEGFLFPATYDFEPGTKPVDMLKQMVARTEQALDQLQIPTAQRMTVLTEASIVQAEAGSSSDMGKIARVLDNRLADGMPLQLDTTVNYANGKAGVTTSPEDRRNPSPYNTYVHKGLPPGAISNPGEDALRAVLSPTPGNWRFFVVVNPDTGETRFAATAAEHQQNVLLFQKWLREHPGG
jgi:uncharacterized YceG family protein